MTWTSLRSGMASRGVLFNAHKPAATPKIVSMKTKKTLRALASMMRSSRKGLRSVAMAEGVSIGLPRFQCALNLSLGIDQKICACDDTFVFLQAGFDFVEIAVLAAKVDEARLDLSFAFVHEGNIVQAGWQDGAYRHGEALAHIGGELDIDVHIGAQREIGIWDVNAYAGGAGGVVDERVNNR